MVLQEYSELIGTAAAVMTISQMLSPCTMCYGIVKKNSCKGVDYTPFVGGMGMSVLMLQHGLMLNDAIMIYVNVFGFILNLVYVYIYYCYTDDKETLLATTAKITLVVSCLVGYANYDDPTRGEPIFGIIVTLLLFMLIGSPLFSLKEIIHKKSSAGLPFPLISTGTVVCSLWFLYGLAVDNVFIVFQNLVGLSLCTIQLSLFFIYPSTESDGEYKITMKTE